MPSLQEQARDEAYASAPIGAEPRSMVELYATGFDVPLFFLAGVEDDTPVVLEDGTTVTALACAFRFTPPGADKTGPTPAKLGVDNVSGKILPYLKAATGAISVTYRAYLGDDYGTVVDLIEGLKLKRATVAAATVDGELSFEEIATQAFPRRTYDLDTYGALWNA
ncbi:MULTISPECIES: DUF1833 family protein [Methylobacterium]|uniref:DUF1833 domain-containing protein n=1 Tax=Methylobacterium jeotgali TaxID=381630 RepID=A0ABQ4SXC8_9HYPH|nr:MULTISPECIES: DUF1833 family protein [Methylobacterium]PIU06849.1 MAG: hypothetical protein COT56_07715 [Methylobacterium sp. CG09_land_8_20_14_0_10_71_15]PIU15720.1 MAG: hypothetical protein COT28_03750 [Methylobacterium sp. CG08_land_8_20_14_0_20_71_15]GBU17214.1 hypothetical protein AwMethylo_14290 [Methylobacterium sp.]GJE07871.1 hypothetical protein AOPFMNJM_3203 [Methylobacterium jeotgali]